ncbi:MAG TPA: hypothetical protein VH561_12960 [Micromonosporaceae bacterium]|jgi:hypothetical protein
MKLEWYVWQYFAWLALAPWADEAFNHVRTLLVPGAPTTRSGADHYRPDDYIMLRPFAQQLGQIRTRIETLAGGAGQTARHGAERLVDVIGIMLETRAVQGALLETIDPEP